MPASERPAGRDDDRARLSAAIQDAGAIALKTFGGPLKSWTKSGDSPVTEADIAVNDLLLERLLGPGDGWLSEESENDPTRLAARRVWVVDPIDGTRAYIAGREDWSISVALVEDGRPVLAALQAPVTGELFLATRGKGSTRNGTAIQASDGDGLDGARVAGPKRMLDQMVERIIKALRRIVDHPVGAPHQAAVAREQEPRDLEHRRRGGERLQHAQISE